MATKLRMFSTLVILLSVSLPLITCQHVTISLNRTTSIQGGDLGQPITSYYANVNVGTPPKPFKLLVDLNAREVWIPHHMTLGAFFNRLNYKDGYAKRTSSTSSKWDREYTIEYDRCELTGKAYQDIFEFTNKSQPVRFSQGFLAISSASNDRFTKYGVDGVLALNPYVVSESGVDLITVGLSKAKVINELRFSILLEDKQDSDSGGELVFGGQEDKSKYEGTFRYHYVIGQYKWELNLLGVVLGSNDIACSSGGGCSAVISTSRNEIYGPPKDVQQILKLLGVIKDVNEYKDDKLYEIDCLRVADAPKLTFAIDNQFYTIDPIYYIRKKVNGLIFKSSTCYVAILSNGSQKSWELGTNFLANFYTMFDVNLRRVAFGKRKARA